jgi:hypothetical protein
VGFCLSVLRTAEGRGLTRRHFPIAKGGGRRNIATVMNPPDEFPVLLMFVLGIVFAVALTAFYFVRRTTRRERSMEEIPEAMFNQPAFSEPQEYRGLPFSQPHTWLAIRNRNVEAVLESLGIQNVTPCSWEDGLAGFDDRKIFVSPPIGGWVLVFGSSLPEPGDDIDVVFRFVTGLSGRLGHVQYFHSNPVVYQHAWARSEYGRILRGFAWTDETVWHQGGPTLAERQLGMICPDYGDRVECDGLFGQPEFVIANAERVPALAARWSVDLAKVDARVFDRQRGVAGEPRLPGLC